MKIIFLCGSFEPGRDGVGDYVRLLATALADQGCLVAIAAINDGHVSDVVDFEDHGISILRIPSKLAMDKRFSLLHLFTENFDADWISLQFVPFSFHPRGLISGMAKKLKAVTKSRKIHIMFHELWIGIYGSFTLKQRMLGFLQKILIKSLIRDLRPDLITTTLTIYKESLDNPNTQLLPLFGNIPIHSIESEPVMARDDTKFTAIHFGSFSGSSNDFELQLQYLVKAAKKIKKVPVLKAAGAGGIYKDKALETARKILGADQVYDLGKLSEISISRHFLTSDLGLSRADFTLFGKSGSAIAMLEHGLPLLLRGKRPATGDLPKGRFKPQLVFWDDQPLEQWKNYKPESLVKEISTQYLKMIN